MTKLRKVGGLLFSLALLGGVIFAWTQRQDLYDWYRLRGYDPPATVAQLARDTTMSGYSRKVFYVNHPDLESKGEFNQHCPQTEQTIVLGCYVKNGGIYLYNVQDKRLAGVEEVTAAHELLHALYDRLSDGEKSEVNGLLKQAYAGVNDPRIRKNISSYQREGANITNELHSILGTEVRNLPKQLEDYYQKYFSNRLKIVDYSENYEQIFTSNQAKIVSLKKDIDSAKTELNNLHSSIDSLRAQVSEDYDQLQQLSNNGQVEEFNNRVPAYNAKVNLLRAKIEEFNQKVSYVNELVRRYNQLSVEQSSLYRALDSHIKSAPR